MSEYDDIDAQTQALIQRGEIERAVALASQALRQRPGGVPRARALLALAGASLPAGRFADALRAALAADALYRDAGNDAGSGESLLKAAAALRAAGDHSAAVELLERVEQQARRRHDARQLAQALRQIGVSSSVLGRHQHALSCLAEAESMCAAEGRHSPEHLNAVLSLLNARNRRVASLPEGDSTRGPTLEALLPAWAALAADCAGPEHRRLRAMALGNRAITLHQLGRDGDAAAALEALLPQYRALGMKPNEGLCLCEWAHCLRGLGQIGPARERYRQAIALLDSAGTVEDRIAAYEGLAEVEEQLGDTAAALAALKHLRTLERRGSDESAKAGLLQRELRIELARLTSQWAREASEDPLTGLGNRRALQAWLRDHLPGIEQGETLSLVLLDLDHFKQVNDVHGHAIGDVVLQQVARLLAQGCRGRDRAVRYGGEEFVLALAGASRHEAEEVAERVRQMVADHPWGRVSPGLRVTASLGVAEATEAADPQALLTLADKRLYAAKLAGRNRVVAAA